MTMLYRLDEGRRLCRRLPVSLAVVKALMFLLCLVLATPVTSFTWQQQQQRTNQHISGCNYWQSSGRIHLPLAIRSSSSSSKQLQPNRALSTTTGKTTTATTGFHHRYQRMSPLQMSKTPSDNNDNNNDNNNSSYAWLGTLWFPLWLVYISNQWSRSSLYYLVDFSTTNNNNPLVAMNVDLDFTEAQYGVLASVAFTSLYAGATVLAGYISDRYNRKTLTILSVGAWTLATLATAISTDYTQVLLARIAMGLACAFSTPIGYTLLQQSLPSNQQSFGTGLYGTGVAFGGALGALSLLLDQTYGWRQALFIISAFGALSTILTTVVLPDDPKEQQNKQPQQLKEGDAKDTSNSDKDDKDSSSNLLFASLTTDIGQVLSTRRVQWLFLASLLRFCSGLCIGVWSAPFFRQAFPDHAADYSVIQALITAIAGSVSGLGGGYLADQISSSSSVTATTTPPVAAATTTSPSTFTWDSVNPLLQVDAIGRRLYVPVVGSLLAAPAWYWAISQQQLGGGGDGGGAFEWAMVWLTLEYLVAECWFGPTISTLQATVGPRIGGTAQGLFTLTGAIANLAPTALGLIYGNYLNSLQEVAAAATEPAAVTSVAELSHLLAIAVCFGYVSSAFCFAMSAQSPPPPLSTPSSNSLNGKANVSSQSMPNSVKVKRS